MWFSFVNHLILRGCKRLAKDSSNLVRELRGTRAVTTGLKKAFDRIGEIGVKKKAGRRAPWH